MSRSTATSRRTRRRIGLVAAVGLVLALFQGAGIGAASAAEPDHVTTTLSGCKNSGGIVLPNGDGKFICADSDYTTGNLGKGWNELDLVPYRLELTAGTSAPASQTYTIAYAVDAMDAGAPGYDFLSAAELNTDLSTVGKCTVGPVGGEVIMTPGLGGIEKTRFRTLEITQPKNSTCVLDFYARLAIGSHLFPGSSLHANLALPVDDPATTVTTSGIGARDVSIPVKEIAPQELSKDMAASLDADHLWTVEKSPTPASLAFGDTCTTATKGASLDVEVTVTWTKMPASPTGYTVTTNVYATNPASRIITVTATDVIYSGTTSLDTVTFDPVDVPANTTSFKIGTHAQDFTTAEVGSPPNFNDVATATYTDKATGIPVPGTTTATASVANADIAAGTTTNTTATVSDTETITGDGLSFSVAEPSVGTFSGYTAGTTTTGPVDWSYEVSDGGSVTFTKTVYLDQPRIVTGSLDDTATVKGTDSGESSAPLSIGISADATVALTIDKTLSPASSDALSFDFGISGPDGYSDSVNLAFPAGTTTNSTTLTGLAPGSYVVDETATGPFGAQSKTADITLPTCAKTVSFENTFTPPTAQVTKVTVPSGSEAGWTFTLTGQGLPAGGIDAVTTGSSPMAFEVGGIPVALQTGEYATTETTQTGWDLTDVTGSPGGRITSDVPGEKCTFSVSQIADAGTTFECVFTNTQRGRIRIDKVTDPAADPQSFDFTLTGGPSGLNESFSLTDTADPYDSGAIKPGSGYSAAETLPDGWDKTSATCDDKSPVTDISVSPGETVTCTFTNTKRGNIVVHKSTDPAGSTTPFDFTLTGGPSSLDEVFQLKDGEQKDSGAIKPGDGYAAGETVPDGWDLSSTECSDKSPVGDIDVGPGETVHCYFTNTQRGQIVIDKVTVPAGDAEEFAFTLTGGPEGSTIDQSFKLADATDPHNSGFVKPGSGYSAAEIVPTGWDLTSATCSDNSPVTDISVSAGETVICTFTDTKRAEIIVDKVTDPKGSSQSFSFGLTGGPEGDTVNQPFSLTDAADPYSSGLVKAGTYAVAETPVTGWDLTAAECDDGSPIDAIDLAPGEKVTCTFTNTQRGVIKVDKVTVPRGDSQEFGFTAGGGPSELTGSFTLTDATTPWSSGYVLPGSGYSVAESAVAGWDLTSAVCDDESPVENISVSPGEVITCTFTNTKRGHIIVDKVTDPAKYPQSFGFTLTGGPDAVSKTFSLADVTTPYDSGAVKPGTYAAAEDTPLPFGWTLQSATCDDKSPVGAIDLAPGETVTCIFTDRARGAVSLVKTLNQLPIPADSTAAFTFQLRQGASLTESGTTLEVKTADKTNAGVVGTFSTELVPGQTYQMCEIVMPGWSTSLGTFVPDSFLPPDGVVADPNVDNSILCANFTVTPGQTFAFTVDNTPPPGGRALTIGFWKNWASCSKSTGKQAPVLDETLAAAMPTGIVVSAGSGAYPAFGAVHLVLSSDDCQAAVALLSKSTTDTGKVKAADPAFNLAAQLVAAELNYTAGAGRTPSTTSAITEAVRLLGKYQFDGTGYSGKISKADAARMAQLATMLDDYNNNRL